MKDKFIIWGTGDKSVLYTESLNGRRPEFYIDNNINKSGIEFYNRLVKHPSQIDAWKEYYIVIAIERYEEVQKQLIQYGLKKGEDFVFYMDVLNTSETLEKMVKELEGSLKHIKNNVEKMRAKALVFGAMISFDYNCKKNLNELYKKFGEGSFILLSESMKIKKMAEEGEIFFPYYILPKMLLQNYYLKKTGIGKIELDYSKEKYIEDKEYLQNARKIMYTKNRDIEPNYDVEVIYYYDIFVRTVLDMLEPKYVVMWNQFYPFHLIIDNVCKEKNIKTIYIEHGSLPGTYAVDTFGQMGECSVTINAKKFVELSVTEEEIENAKKVWTYLYNSKLNRNQQPENDVLTEIKRNLKPERPIIFYAGQNDYESCLFPYTERTKKYHSPNFKSSYDALKYLSKLASEKDWNLIYKPHPLCVDNIEELCENVILVKNCDINDLIDMSDVTVTVLSQVGYVSTIRKKATVMLGYIQLKGKGCTYEAYEKDNICTTLEKAIKEGFTKEQEECFLVHIAQLNKYYLYDNEGEKEVHFGRRIKDLGDKDYDEICNMGI